MKPITIAVLLLTTVSIWGQDEGKLTSEERSEISAHLQYSWDQFENLIKGLTSDQWNYKPADSVWSIAEISEHLEKSEKALFSLVVDQLKASEAQPEKMEEIKGKTRFMMETITSRENKVTTRPDLEPKGLYNSPQDFLKSFSQLRYETLTYAMTTEDELRHHFIPFGPLGELDGYQILMFISGHTERHIQQIEELMDDPRYPPT